MEVIKKQRNVGMGKNKKVEKPDDENYSVIVEEGEETLGQIPTKDPKKEEETLDRAPVEEPDRILVKTRGTATNAVDGVCRKADGGRRNGAPVYVMEHRETHVIKFSVFALEPSTGGCSHQVRAWYITAKIDGVENSLCTVNLLTLGPHCPRKLDGSMLMPARLPMLVPALSPFHTFFHRGNFGSFMILIEVWLKKTEMCLHRRVFSQCASRLF